MGQYQPGGGQYGEQFCSTPYSQPYHQPYTGDYHRSVHITVWLEMSKQGITVAGMEEEQSPPCTLVGPSPTRGTTSTRDINNTTTTTTTTTCTQPQVSTVKQESLRVLFESFNGF